MPAHAASVPRNGFPGITHSGVTATASGYELTALGAVLLDRTEIACDMLEQVFGSQPYFDPEQEDREFVILASDYAVTVFGAELARGDQRAGAAGKDQLPAAVGGAYR